MAKQMTDKITVKSDGTSFYNPSTTVKFNGKDIPQVKSMKIDFILDEPITATIEVYDLELDLNDIEYKINVNELGARLLLLRILRDKGTMLAPSVLDDVLDMTKGME